MYYDPSLINLTPSSQKSYLTCQVGTQLLQDYFSRNDSLNIDCITPYYAQVQAPEDLFPQIQIQSINPSFMFMDELFVKVYVQATPIYNLTSIICRFHDVQVPGVYEVVSGAPMILCILPSYVYLKV